jgi:hypothetical protein
MAGIPVGLETAASSYSFGENFGAIFGEPLPKGHAVRTPMGIIVGGGNEGGNTDVEGFTPRSEILAT